MDEQQRKAMLKQTFDTVADGYDGGALRFFPQSAQYMTPLLELRGDEHALDVACGTGHASLAVARALPRGRMTGVANPNGTSCRVLHAPRSHASTVACGIISAGWVSRG